MTDNINAAFMRLYKSMPASWHRKGKKLVLAGDEVKWWAAEKIDDLVAERPIDPLRGRPYSKTAIRRTVGYRIKKSGHTVRNYEWVASHVTPALRSDYPSLTFEYWRVCCNAKTKEHETKEDAVIRMAEEIIEHRDAWGDMPSLDEVWGWLKKNGDIELPYIGRIRGIIASCDAVIEDARTPAEVREYLASVREWLGDVI